MCLLLSNGAISYLDVPARNGSLGEITPQSHLSNVVMEMSVSVFFRNAPVVWSTKTHLREFTLSSSHREVCV